MSGLRQMFRRDSDSDESEEDDPNSESPEELHMIDCYESASKGIKIFLHQDRVLGIAHQLWPAALTLVNYLENNLGTLFPDGISKECFIELGAGVGLVGLFVAALGANKVVLTDIEEAQANLEHNILINPSLKNNVEAAVLSWGDERESLDCLRRLPIPPYLLASDCVYWEHLFEPLRKTIQFFVDAGSIVLMSHVRRWKKDTKFFNDCSKTMSVRIVHEDIRRTDRREIRRIYRISK